MISQKIQTLIDEVKAESNSLERNKIVSKLEDAKAWAIVRERKYQDAPHPAETVGDPNQPRRPMSRECICNPPNTAPFNPRCPVHGL